MTERDFWDVFDYNKQTFLYFLVPFSVWLVIAYCYVDASKLYNMVVDFDMEKFSLWLDQFVIEAFILVQLWKSGRKFFGVIYCISSVADFETKLNPQRNRVTIEAGTPGAGKSSTAGYKATLAASKMWRELRYKYWSVIGSAEEILSGDDEDKKTEVKEIIESYEYYANNDCVPCLMSNIPMMIDGKYTSVLTYEHAEQKRRIPAYTVLFFDESGATFSVDAGKSGANRPLCVSDFFRLCRHFGDFVIYMTEQDQVNVFIDVRRVVAVNQFILYQQHVLKPKFLIGIYEFLKSYYIRSGKGTKGPAPERMAKFGRLINKIGFRRYVARNEGNSENNVTENGEELEAYYLPSQLNFRYDDRTFRNLYKAKKYELIKDIWGSLTLPETASEFLRSTLQENKKK